ncbi:hypothetical protein E9677_01265 [Rhizobium rhizophilum]|uniref:Propionyl-coenzyme A carboxylase alpha polypeptide n=1 Tax=Rhizobium rhizophilum TaxID=1850373 RepID=A0ABY2R1D8_9HYPH|nr:hypothetical protein E9677_01265 [Rhizobium rhizophilum]
MRSLPLTLTLSPQAGRGDVPQARTASGRNAAVFAFSPLAGRRCRQADEGQSFPIAGPTPCH